MTEDLSKKADEKTVFVAGHMNHVCDFMCVRAGIEEGIRIGLEKGMIICYGHPVPSQVFDEFNALLAGKERDGGGSNALVNQESGDVRNLEPVSPETSKVETQCIFCDEVYETIDDLRVHLKVVHSVAHAEGKDECEHEFEFKDVDGFWEGESALICKKCDFSVGGAEELYKYGIVQGKKALRQFAARLEEFCNELDLSQANHDYEKGIVDTVKLFRKELEALKKEAGIL